MKVDERLWRIMQKRLGYTDDEAQKFRENPRNEEVLVRSGELISKVIIFEVVEAHGCNSRYKVGDKLYFDGAGNLITELCPKKVCAFSLSSPIALIFAVSEMVYAGVDPNEMLFKRVDCFDVGLACGGWGRVVMEMSVEERT